MPFGYIRTGTTPLCVAGLQNLFGATECTGLHTALPNRFAVSHNDSVGLSMPVCDVRMGDLARIDADGFVYLGERVGAVVAPVPDHDVDLDAVATHARAHLARHKVPELWHLSPDPLPRNAGGKLLKNTLRKDLDWSAAEFIAQRSRRA